MGFAYLVVAIASAAYAGRALRAPSVDGDLYWQKHLGGFIVAHHALPAALGPETFTAAGAPWTPHEWLFAIAVFIASSHDAVWVLALAAAGCVAFTLFLTAARAGRAGASAPAIAIAIALLSVDLEGSFGVRAQVFAWPLFVALMYVLDASGPAIFWAVPIVALWANVHASALLAIPIVWIDALAGTFGRGVRDRETWRRWALAAIVPFAVLATPLGVRLPAYALTLLASPIRHSINEWQPVGPHTDFFWGGGAPMLLLALLCARVLARERPRDALWAVPLAIMAIGAVRNVALFGFVVAPLAARAIDVLLARWSWWPFDPMRVAAARRWVVAGAIVAAVAAFAVMVRLPPKNEWIAPQATLQAIAARPGEHRLFCYDFTMCSVALDYPNVRVFLDGRADPYPLQVWNDFNVLRRAHAGWAQLVDGYGIDAVLVKRGDALDRALSKRKEWTALPQTDRCCRGYVRPQR